MHVTKFLPLLLFFSLVAALQSCYKKEIEFGDDPENNYTRIVFTDTVAVKLSTVMIDSFSTSGATSMLLGKHKDPYLGIVAAKPFFRLSPAAAVDIPVTAVFDSLVFIVRTNDYYYGDTTRAQTISVYELAQSISLSYNDKLYNTSDVAIKQPALGSRTLKISPVATDSILIRLNNAKGLELFEKLKQRSEDVTQEDDFLNYFKGISLSVGDNDTTAIYGLSGTTSMTMRIIYHHSTPSVEEKYIDFALSVDNYAFNQVLSDRSGTSLPSSVQRVTEFPSTQTGGVSFSQYGAGLLLKMTFPSLKDILRTDDIVKLLKAELIIRPAHLSFDRYRYKLPGNMHLAMTDGSNIIGQTIADSSGADQYVSPYIDAIYGENSHYRFDVTYYINQILQTAGGEEYGFYFMEKLSPSALHINRAVINDANRSNYKTQLLLSVVVVNN